MKERIIMASESVTGGYFVYEEGDVQITNYSG